VRTRSLGKEDTLNREEKGEAISELRKKFSAAKSVIFTDYKGMTVAELSEMRRLLRSAGVEYRIVKNTLARIVCQDTPASVGGSVFEGPVAVALGYDDAVAAAKKVVEFARKSEKLKLRCGVVEGRFVDVEEVKAIAALPTKNVLLSMLAGTFQSPLSTLAAAFSATVTGFTNAINGLKEKRTTQTDAS
jgi:large subunit ribosomal protein L10